MGDSVFLDIAANNWERVSAKIAELRQNMDKLANTAQGAQKGIDKSIRGFQNLGRAISSITRRMAIRTALNILTKGIKEGIDNLYQFSIAVGNTDQAMAKSTMDQYASGFMYLKNSLGAMVMPVIQALIPLFEQLTSWIITATNWINQFFAALSGSTFFTRAKRTAVEFGEAAAGATGKAAKALKDYVMGWDELHVIHPTSDTGSGGGAGSALDYGSMFENADIDRRVKDNLAAITAAVSIGSFGLGVALFLSGHPGIGLGLMYAGYKLNGQLDKLNWETIPAHTRETLASVAVGLTALLSTLGVVLLMSGHPALGLGLIAAGFMTGRTLEANWDKIPSETERALKRITTAMAIAMGAIGFIMLFNPTTFAAGLTLIVGALGLTAATFDVGSWLTNKITSVWSSISGWWKEHVVPKLQGAFDWVKSLIDKIPGHKNVEVTMSMRDYKIGVASGAASGILGSIYMYASGGYPTLGDLFIANEAGPELVGTVNGRTAVASNNEITGISDTIRETSATTAALLAQLIQVAGNSTIKVGEREFGEVVRDSLNYLSRTQGSNGLVMGGI